MTNKKRILKKYKIYIPAFVLHIEANNEEEALEQFNFDYDQAHQDEKFDEPIIEEEF